MGWKERIPANCPPTSKSVLWHRHTRPLLQEVNIWGGGVGRGERKDRKREAERQSFHPRPRDQACPLPSHFFCACSGRWAVFHPVSQLQGSQPTQKGCESSYSFIPQKQALLTSCPIKPFFPDKQASTIREGGGEAHTIVMIHTLSLLGHSHPSVLYVLSWPVPTQRFTY